MKKITLVLGKPGIYFKTYSDKIVVENISNDIDIIHTNQIRDMSLSFIRDVPNQSMYRKTLKFKVDVDNSL